MIDTTEAPFPTGLLDPRAVRVRFSALKHMARSPLHYLDAVQTDRGDTLAMRRGRGVHAMVLGEPVVKFTGKVRSGKAWQAFAAEHEGSEILNEREWHEAAGIARAIRSQNPEASRLLLDGTVLEGHIEWEWLGRTCSSRPDARGVSHIADLKTTQCSDPERFRWDAKKRGYHAQLAFYGLAVKHLTGVEPTELWAIAVESKRPYAVTKFRLTDNARLAGEKMCRAWFERLLLCEASNCWPGYTDGTVDLDVQEESDPDAAIELDDMDGEAWA
jgi:hypothetical protein